MKEQNIRKGIMKRLLSVVLAFVLVMGLTAVNMNVSYAAGATYKFVAMYSATRIPSDYWAPDCENVKYAALSKAEAGDIIQLETYKGTNIDYQMTGGDDTWNTSGRIGRMDGRDSVSFTIPSGYEVTSIAYGGPNYHFTFSCELEPLTCACNTLTTINGQAPTCTQDGWIDYYQCEACGRLLYDTGSGTTAKIIDLETWKRRDGKVPKLGHTLGYIAYGPTLTASCVRKAACGLDDVTVSLRVDNMQYTGHEYTGATLSNVSAWTNAGLIEPDIMYVGRGATTYPEDDTPPLAVGTYTAVISVGDPPVSASADFEITKASQYAPAPGTCYRINNRTKTITAQDGYEISTSDTALIPPADGKIVTGVTYFIRKMGDENYHPSPWTRILLPASNYLETETSPGHVNDITRSTGGALSEINPYDVTIRNSAILEALLSLTPEELEEGVNVWLEIKDAWNMMSASDKAAIEQEAGLHIIGLYLDATLFKKVGDNVEAVSDLNGKMQISFVVPVSLRKEGRNFAIIRVHEGNATTIPGAYDASTGIFTFETDGFSSYALVYHDTASTASNAVISPKTGESNGTYAWMILLVACMGVLLMTRKRRDV